MRGFSGTAAALLLAVSVQSSSAQSSSAQSSNRQSSSGQSPEPPALRGAVNAPAPSVFRDAVHGRAVDSAAAASAAAAAVAPQNQTGPVNLTAVPEPSSVAMLASGAIGLVGALWRRRRRR